MEIDRLNKLLGTADCPLIIDVRSGMEFRSGHIPGARHCPFWKFPAIVGELLAQEREIVLTCEHGPRAQLALGLLRLRGCSRGTLLAGHMHRWKANNLPLTGKTDRGGSETR